MTTTEAATPLTPKHGYTKDGTPVYARTHHYLKTDAFDEYDPDSRPL